MINKKLEKFINNENRIDYKDYSLATITKILHYYGNPEKKFKSIHIAGTNGKGSVAYMLNSIFMQSGYKTGLYTSPHLIKINERIAINNKNIDDKTMNDYIDDLLKYLETDNSIVPTFFDILTIIAFRYFSDNNADIGIIETGLGGRLDSTNVIDPICSIITDISLDHTALLGNTVKEIASEKGGIIKKNRPIITSNMDNDILYVLKEKADELKSDMFILNNNFFTNNIIKKPDCYEYTYELNAGSENIIVNNIVINNRGEFQIKNSANAITASLISNNYFPKVTEKNIRDGLKNITIPGRLQILNNSPLIIFDPAHNPAAISSVLDTLTFQYGNMTLYLIVTLMRDKDYNQILSIIAHYTKNIIYYELFDSRSYKPSEDNSSLKSLKIVNNEDDLNRLLQNVPDKSLILFTGSFRLYSIALYYADNIKKA